VGDLTQRLVARAVRFAESGATPVEPRLAATVLLLRPAGGGFEVYLVRRAAGMAFASGMYAFPGGVVEPVDRAGEPLAGDWPARLGRPAGEAEAVVRAAVREVAEETGVRLAAGDLVGWARWITPEFEPRRYDTYFFLTRLPDGQRPAAVTDEADHTQWLRPAEAVARCEAGEIAMLPPTLVTLRELARHDSVEAALAAAAARDCATPVRPRLVRDPDGTARIALTEGPPGDGRSGEGRSGGGRPGAAAPGGPGPRR
jgi:8-oxo-dGTP pyrophosphatase MutT (NUDIX family)